VRIRELVDLFLFTSLQFVTSPIKQRFYKLILFDACRLHYQSLLSGKLAAKPPKNSGENPVRIQIGHCSDRDIRRLIYCDHERLTFRRSVRHVYFHDADSISEYAVLCARISGDDEF
jgi:hypothetical protein